MTQMRELVELAKPLLNGDGFTSSRIHRVRLYRSSSPIPRQPILYDSWIVANLQGRKTLYYADRTLQYDDNSILCVTSGSPVDCEAHATPGRPLIAVVIDLRMDELLGMSARMAVPGRSSSKPPRVVDVFPFTEQLREVYSQAITIEELAANVAMSESAFHLHFRKITS